ncbi:MAG: hypothetical protein E7Z65_02955 [Thermoplasmata archaeon]|nr:hypothetical protein [Thermoplasmata archaeon]
MILPTDLPRHILTIERLLSRDPVAVMLGEDVNKVKAVAEKCFEDAGQDGGYIFGPGCALPLSTSVQNIQALVEVSKKHPY